MAEYASAAGDWEWAQFDLDGARDAIRNAAARVGALLRATTDSTQHAERSDWTISETAAHLVVVARANTAYARGQTTPVLELDRLAQTNRERINELPERDVHILARALEDSIAEMLEVTNDHDPADIVPWHSHTQLPIGGMLGIVLAELLLHGRDIARPQNTRWRIEASDAVHVVRGGFAFGPLVIDRELARTHPITYRVRCRGVPTAIYRFADGSLTITPDRAAPVHCQLRLGPVTLMLIAFGRRSPYVAALQGRAMSWGRRPLAAFRVPSYFVPS